MLATTQWSLPTDYPYLNLVPCIVFVFPKMKLGLKVIAIDQSFRCMVKSQMWCNTEYELTEAVGCIRYMHITVHCSICAQQEQYRKLLIAPHNGKQMFACVLVFVITLKIMALSILSMKRTSLCRESIKKTRACGPAALLVIWNDHIGHLMRWNLIRGGFLTQGHIHSSLREGQKGHEALYLLAVSVTYLHSNTEKKIKRKPAPKGHTVDTGKRILSSFSLVSVPQWPSAK